MDTCIELVLIEHLLQALTVADVHLVERNLLANNLGNTFQRDWRRVVQVVNYYSLMACLGKLNKSVASNETSTTSQKDFHFRYNYLEINKYSSSMSY